MILASKKETHIDVKLQEEKRVQDTHTPAPIPSPLVKERSSQLNAHSLRPIHAALLLPSDIYARLASQILVRARASLGVAKLSVLMACGTSLLARLCFVVQR